MIRVLVVADSGSAMAAVTASLEPLTHVYIAAYASGRARLGAIVQAVRPDVVLVDEMRHPARAQERIREVRAARPESAVVGLGERPDGAWIAGALRAGASAVVPRELDSPTLGLVLAEVLAAPRERHVAPAVERSAA